MPAYQLAPHVHGCSTGDYTVFLDLKRNRYLGVGASDSHALEPLIVGWPRNVGATHTAAMNGARLNRAASELLDELIQCDMVCCESDDAGKTRRSIDLDHPQIALLDGYVRHRADLKLSDATRFFSAVFTAAVALKFYPLHKIIARLIDRRASAGPRADAIDVDHARSCVAAFSRLQSLLFTARDACLLHSLALSEFLARQALFPHVVIGVATTPFAAHCWIQHREVIFNDELGHVRRFTPILVV